jgi:hypothetical protein
VPNPTNTSEAIGGRLLGSYGGADLVEALAARVEQRVYPSKPTQGVAGDYVVYWRAGGSDGSTLAGATGLRANEVRVEAVSDTQAGAEAALDAAAALLDGWRDRAIGVQGCFAVGDRDEAVFDDGRQVSGQTFTLHFKAQG